MGETSCSHVAQDSDDDDLFGLDWDAIEAGSAATPAVESAAAEVICEPNAVGGSEKEQTNHNTSLASYCPPAITSVHFAVGEKRRHATAAESGAATTEIESKVVCNGAHKHICGKQKGLNVSARQKGELPKKGKPPASAPVTVQLSSPQHKDILLLQPPQIRDACDEDDCVVTDKVGVHINAAPSTPATTNPGAAVEIKLYATVGRGVEAGCLSSARTTVKVARMGKEGGELEGVFCGDGGGMGESSDELEITGHEVLCWCCVAAVCVCVWVGGCVVSLSCSVSRSVSRARSLPPSLAFSFVSSFFLVYLSLSPFSLRSLFSLSLVSLLSLSIALLARSLARTHTHKHTPTHTLARARAFSLSHSHPPSPSHTHTHGDVVKISCYITSWNTLFDKFTFDRTHIYTCNMTHSYA